MASVQPKYNKEGKIISYKFFCSMGRDEVTGKLKNLTKTVPAPDGLTPAKALKKMQTEANLWEEEVKKGNAPVKRMSFKHFIDEQFIPVHVCGGDNSPTTVKFYKDICEHLISRFGNKNLDAIRSIDIERYLVDLSKETYKRGKNGEERTYSATYIGHHRTVLTVAFGFADRHGLIERNPMKYVRSVKADRKEVDFLTEDEAIKYLKCLEESASMFWKTAMNVLIRCGLRRGELVGLQWGDVDFNNRTLTVCRDVINNEETGRKNMLKSTKTTHSDRVVPLDVVLVSKLKAWKKELEMRFGILMPTAFIFGSEINCYECIRPDTVTQWQARFTKSHGLRNVSPHDLRHTCATLLLKHDATIKEVQTIMGHSDASTTLKYYCGTDMESLKEASDRLGQALAVGE